MTKSASTGRIWTQIPTWFTADKTVEDREGRKRSGEDDLVLGWDIKDLDRLGPAAKKKIIAMSTENARRGAQKQKVKELGKNKYGAKKESRVLRNGSTFVFASGAEARRYDELVLMLKSGEILDLKLQPEFTLQEAYTDLDGERHKALHYRADFSYNKIVKEGVADIRLETVVEDVKGVETDVYKLKKALVAGGHAVKIVEVK